MNAIELLLQRQSNPSLTAPAPDVPDLDNILSAGMRVPDHGCLKPWHFTVIQNEGLKNLSDLFVKAVNSNHLLSAEELEKKIEKATKMPFRAPMIIVISTRYTEHEKVPKSEQFITAGCSSHAMQMAAFALGYGAIWRTGELAYNDTVKKGLNISDNNDIVGFLYLGTANKTSGIKPVRSYKEHVSYWN